MKQFLEAVSDYIYMGAMIGFFLFMLPIGLILVLAGWDRKGRKR